MPITCKTKFWHQLDTMHSGMGMVQVLYPDNPEQLRECISFAKAQGKKLFVIGSGTNLIGCDEDFACIAVRLPAKLEMRVSGTTVHCNAGVLGTRLFTALAAKGIGGAAALSGIPGTLGGLLKMNAGANGMEICQFVKEMHGVGMKNGESWHWTKQEGGWSYRQSPVPDSVCISSATLEMLECNSEQEADAIRRELERRRRVTPSWWSAGSVFRNPSPSMPAGRLLEEAGCKGMEQFPFQVSNKHANWIVNAQRQAGKAAAVLKLIGEMQACCNVNLQCEVCTPNILIK